MCEICRSLLVFKSQRNHKGITGPESVITNHDNICRCVRQTSAANMEYDMCEVNIFVAGVLLG